jgi:hypothetical protein
VPSFARGGPSFDLDVPLDSIPDGQPLGSIGVVFAACAGTIRLTPTVAAPVTCVDASGSVLGRDDFMWGEKRITVTTELRNANPTIAEVLLDSVPWAEAEERDLYRCDADALADCPEDQRHVLEALPSEGSAETVLGQTEQLVLFWFVAEGRVQDDFEGETNGRFSTVFAPTHADVQVPLQAWAVLRDDRGGVDWAVRTYRAVAPPR